MKSRPLFAIFFIAAFFIMIAMPNPSRAITFPIEYSGDLHIKQTFGSGPSCEAVVPIYIQLRPEGTIYGILPFDFKDTTKSNDLNSCEIIQTDDFEPDYVGRHDKVGTFEIPIKILGNYLTFAVTGSFDELQITGSGFGSSYNGHMNMTISFKALAVGVSQPPQITLEHATYPEFQISVLTGNGFTVKIRKEDGVVDSFGNLKLNLSTLVFATDGADNSMNFINTAISQGIVSATIDEKEVRFNIIPDPTKFMADQNVFNIQMNGEHKIGLQICDTDGLCGSSEYTLYFGPFISVGSVTDMRCNDGKEQLDLGRLVLGNMGYDSPLTDIYMALINTDQPDEYWCYGITYDFGSSYVWFERMIIPYIKTAEMPGALLVTLDKFPLNLHKSKPSESSVKPFPAGNYSFLAIIIDNMSRALKQDVKDVKTCSLP